MTAVDMTEYGYPSMASAPRDGTKVYAYCPDSDRWIEVWWETDNDPWTEPCWCEEYDIPSRVEPVCWQPIIPSPLNRNQKLFLLECMKMASEEGYYLGGHYGSKITGEQVIELGKRLCRETGTSIEGRDWLKG